MLVLVTQRSHRSRPFNIEYGLCQIDRGKWQSVVLFAGHAFTVHPAQLLHLATLRIDNDLHGFSIFICAIIHSALCLQAQSPPPSSVCSINHPWKKEEKRHIKIESKQLCLMNFLFSPILHLPPLRPFLLVPAAACCCDQFFSRFLVLFNFFVFFLSSVRVFTPILLLSIDGGILRSIHSSVCSPYFVWWSNHLRLVAHRTTTTPSWSNETLCWQWKNN